MGIPLRPKDSSAREIIKELKQGFDDPKYDEYEPTLLREAFLSSTPATLNWRVEIIHQVALRRERRGEIDGARALYEKTFKMLKPEDFMTRARLTRDYALLFSYHIDVHRGLELAKQALALHEQDVDNAKGRRQRRITEGYVWRAQVLANEDTGSAVEALTQFALDGCLDCDIRDQQIVVQFSLRYVKADVRSRLLERQMEIHSLRGKPLRTIVSIAHIGVDTSASVARVSIGTGLAIAGKLVRLIIRRE